MIIHLTSTHAPCSSLFNFACKLRAKPVPPVADRFIAYIYSTLMRQVVHISQREWKPHIQHNCKLNDLRAGFEIAERYWIRHIWIANVQHAPGQGGLCWQCRGDMWSHCLGTCARLYLYCAIPAMWGAPRVDLIPIRYEHSAYFLLVSTLIVKLRVTQCAAFSMWRLNKN